MPLCGYQNTLTLSHNPQTLALYTLRNGLSHRLYLVSRTRSPLYVGRNYFLK
nr:MAG TPA: hypothetical protein [Caudoviricetes sp.]